MEMNSFQNNNFSVQLNVNDKIIQELVMIAISGYSKNWIRSVSSDFESSLSFINSDLFEIENKDWVIQLETEDGLNVELDRESLNNGLGIMARDYTEDFINAITGNVTEYIADIFFQCCVYEEVVH